MKKLLLFMAAGCVAASATAQYATERSLVRGEKYISAPAEMPKFIDKSVGRGSVPVQTANTANKTTAPDDTVRWYSHADAIYALNLSPSINQRIFPIWFDSTVLQVFADGPAPVNFRSASQVFDPSRFLVYNDEATYGPTTLGVETNKPYRVDSVHLRGAYVKNPNRNAGVIDTLILSVAPVTYVGVYTPTQSPWVNQYLNSDGSPDTNFRVTRPANNQIDQNRFKLAGSNAISWEVYLDDSMREADSAGFVTITDWAFEVPGGLNVPAGQMFAMTVTFKSGDNVDNPNQDTITQYHRFYVTSHGSNTAAMPYTWYDLDDRNMSGLMFAPTDDPWWIPSIIVEGIQLDPVQMSFEFHDMQARVTCATCRSLSEITSVSTPNVISYVNAYPNPANTEVAIPFNLSKAVDVKVSLSNTMGQVVATQNLGKVNSGKAVFSTTSLTNGVYFYTVEAGGSRSTGRIVVAH